MKNLFKTKFIIFLLLVSISSYAQEKSVGVMSYLQVPETEEDFSKFDTLLTKANELGIKNLSADVWVWDMLKNEKSLYIDNNGNLRINNKFVDNKILINYFQIAKHYGFKLDLIISYHKLGGNVGDLGSVDMPVWAIKLFAEFAVKMICNSPEKVDGVKTIENKICDILPFHKATGEKFIPAEWLFPEGVYLNNKHFENKNETTKHNYHYISPWLTKYFLGFYS